MKSLISKATILFCLYLAITGKTTVGQCTWQTVLTDSFEYTTACPDLIQGTVIHSTPQSFAVHSGNLSLYLNFINCVGTTGTCAGAKVYERGFTVCRNQPVRFSTWLTTSFSGTQCNVRIKITDSNGIVLDDQQSVLAPYAPAWIQYQSPSVAATSDSIIFTIYTNVGGGNGNDLSMDDFVMEKCTGGNIGNSSSVGSVCENANSMNLYSLLPAMNDSTGTWSGPSALSGGYLGTFIPGTNQPGVYIYENPFFGTGAGCPLAYDSLTITLQPPPTVNLGADTILCTNQSLLLSAGSGPGNTYLWSNGVTGPNVLAFTTSTTNVTNTYSVQLTDSSGCTNRDTIIVDFIVCSGFTETQAESQLLIYPNPTNGNAYILNKNQSSRPVIYSVFDVEGSNVLEQPWNINTDKIFLTLHTNGIYFIKILFADGSMAYRKLIVTGN